MKAPPLWMGLWFYGLGIAYMDEFLFPEWLGLIAAIAFVIGVWSISENWRK